MTAFEIFKTKNIDELTDWLDEHGAFDNSPWTKWFDEKYCKQCEPESVYIPMFDDECECSWCELNGKCKYFQELDDTHNNKQTIRMWLESEN